MYEVMRPYSDSLDVMLSGRSGRIPSTVMSSLCLAIVRQLSLSLRAPADVVSAPHLTWLQGMAVAVKCGITLQQLTSVVGVHPTAAEEMVNLKNTPFRRVGKEGQQQQEGAAGGKQESQGKEQQQRASAAAA
jgi:hypothetical protein